MKREKLCRDILVKHLKAFTLVELIVVITILAILGTIGFIGLQNYTTLARDAKRMNNLVLVEKGLSILRLKDKLLPEPEGNITNITFSGTTILTQGEFTQSMGEQLKISGDITDPVDGSNIVYTITPNKKSFQIASFLENPLSYTGEKSLIEKSYAGEGETFFTKGDKLGIVLDEDKNTPVNQRTSPLTTLDLSNSSESYMTFFDTKEFLVGTGSALLSINPKANCQRILETGNARTVNGGNGLYTINPAGEDIEVYCDMSAGGFTDILKGEGFFIDGSGISTESGSNPTNEVIKMKSPVGDDYVLHQTGSGTSEYEIHFEDINDCKTGYMLTMRAWVGDATGSEEIIFHHRAYNALPLNVSENGYYLGGSAYPQGITLDTKIINSINWHLKQYSHIVSDEIYGFSWYLGWLSSHSFADQVDDFYVDGIQLSCVPQRGTL